MINYRCDKCGQEIYQPVAEININYESAPGKYEKVDGKYKSHLCFDCWEKIGYEISKLLGFGDEDK